MNFAKAFLFVAVATVLVFAVLVGQFVWSSRTDPGEFDRYAGKRIRILCGERVDCQVRLRDLTRYDWDQLYEWNGGYSDSDVSQVIGSRFSRRVEFGRVVVLMKGGRMVFLGEGDEGIENSIAGAVFLRCGNRSDSVTMCPPDALMQVKSFEAAGDPARGISWPGTSYVLQQVN